MRAGCCVPLEVTVGKEANAVEGVRTAAAAAAAAGANRSSILSTPTLPCRDITPQARPDIPMATVTSLKYKPHPSAIAAQ